MKTVNVFKGPFKNQKGGSVMLIDNFPNDYTFCFGTPNDFGRGPKDKKEEEEEEEEEDSFNISDGERWVIENKIADLEAMKDALEEDNDDGENDQIISGLENEISGYKSALE